MNPNTFECVKGTWPREAPCVKSLIVESKGRHIGFSFSLIAEGRQKGKSSGIGALGPDPMSPHHSGCGLVPAHV